MLSIALTSLSPFVLAFGPFGAFGSFVTTAPQSAPPAAPTTPPAGAPGAPGRPQVTPPVAAPTRPAAPPIVIEPSQTNLGRVGPGTHHPVVLTIRNVSASPVKILDARPSCKCTTLSSVAGTVIPPGGQVKLEATMDAPNVPGEKDAHVFVTYEGANRPAGATITAMVTMQIEADPPFVDIRNQKLRALTKISALDNTPFNVISAGGKPPVFADQNGKVVPPPSAPESRYWLLADFTNVPPHELMQYWIVETDRPDCPIVPVQVRHEVTGIKFDPTATQRGWLWSESLVNAGRIEAGKTYSYVVEIARYETPGAPSAAREGWGAVKGVQSLSTLASAALESVDTRGDKVSVKFSFTPNASTAGKCIYVPVEVTTATGAGRCFVTASVVPAKPAAPQAAPGGGAK